MENNSFRQLLKSRGFQAFLWTQFLGAFNDNLYKVIVSLYALSHASRGRYLALSGTVFVIPFLLFSGYSGRLADSISKRKVLISVKIFEILVMSFGLIVFFTSRIEWMLAVLFLMALHSAIFSPAKYGIVPEMVANEDLSRANALLEMSTFMAIVLGTSAGAFMFSFWKSAAWKLGVITLAVAVAGFLCSLMITSTSSPRATGRFEWNPLAEVWRGSRQLWKNRPMFLTVVGLSYFWFLGAVFQLDLLLAGKETLTVDDLHVGLMVTVLAIGIGAGSMLAGRLSGDKVELGLVPLGSVFMAILSVALYLSSHSYAPFLIFLALMGLSAGLFAVPLNAYLQQRSGENEKGRIIATNNFYNTIGLLLASGVIWLFHDRLHISPEMLILASGLLTVLVTIYLVTLVPDFLLRFVLWMLTHTVFNISISGKENVPLRGPALLVSNHISHADGFLVGGCVQRFIRFMVWRPFYDMKAFNWFMRLSSAIPVGGHAHDKVDSIQRARRELESGHVVCIFSEGAISRTGNILPFKKGMERILEGSDVPVIPVHIDGIRSGLLDLERGRFNWKRLQRIPFPVRVSFGAPMPASSTVHQVRGAILELSAQAAIERKNRRETLPRAFLRTARRSWSRFALADSSGRKVTFGQALIGSLLIAEWLRSQRRADAKIGLLLPGSVGGALANVGVTMSGKIPVNLNFTSGQEAMSSAIEQCGIKAVITSKAFLEKAKLAEPAGSIFLEDILSQQTLTGKLRAALIARLLPAGLFIRRYNSGITADSVATIIFSSGSTGIPKGVMLSHFNILSNIESVTQVYSLTREDCIIGVLPFFHSFGFTATMWLPLVVGCSAAYQPNPADAKATGALVEKHVGTLLLSAPTFCSGYVRYCTRDQFGSLRFVLVGAEKLRPALAQAFREAFGLDLLEGYGCTEMAPIVAVNSPDLVRAHDIQAGSKPGTVGRPLPGIAARIVDPATSQSLPANQEGMLLLKGPNQMLGYLDQPSRTAEVIVDGWYITGDIALMDDDGFLHITDRISRFSKIGGEMVPHLRVEEAVYVITPGCQCAVTGIADEVRGEQLVLLYANSTLSPLELGPVLRKSSLPRLWIPKVEAIHRVESLPILGTGKLDLRGLKKLAEARMGQAVEAPDGASVQNVHG